MKFGLKVHYTDLAYLIDMHPDALEFALFPGDLEGSWADDVDFDGPIVVHMPEKFKDGTLLDPASPDDKKRDRLGKYAKKDHRPFGAAKSADRYPAPRRCTQDRLNL